MVVGPIIAHDAHRPYRKENCKRLPDRVVEAGVADLLEIDGVGLSKDVALLAGDFARDPDREAGPRKRVALDERLGKAKLAAELPDLVLEQLAKGLDQLHVHPLGETADIVVALDRHRRT